MANRSSLLVCVALYAGSCATSGGDSLTPERLTGPLHWKIDNLQSVGGESTTVVGQPRVVETSQGQAVQFDGVDDALFVDAAPLRGLEKFTAEIVFRPAQNGPREQRFFHLQEDETSNRVLFETRLTDDDRWFLDTFIRSGGTGVTLFAEDFTHPIGPWYHAAIVVDGSRMHHYVNGQLELSSELAYKPQGPGRTSLGVRINRVSWYKGEIREVRVTPNVLAPAEFLKP